jgi:hypothetical protein
MRFAGVVGPGETFDMRFAQECSFSIPPRAVPQPGNSLRA